MPKAPRFVLAPLAAIAVIVAACSASSSATPTATVVPVSFGSAQVHVSGPAGEKDIAVEVAGTPEQTGRGLGYRDSLPADAGMLFDLHQDQVATFWMKGMRFPLDMVWIGADKRVVGAAAGVEPQPGASDQDLTIYSSPQPVRYVLELNAGAAERLGFTQGAQLSFDLQGP